MRRPIWLITVNFGNPAPTLALISNLRDLDQNDALEIAIIDNGCIKFIGSYQYLFRNSNCLLKFSIICKKNIDENIIKNIYLNPKIIKPIVKNNIISFQSKYKDEYLKLIRELINLEIVDLDCSEFSLKDILINLYEG